MTSSSGMSGRLKKKRNSIYNDRAVFPEREGSPVSTYIKECVQIGDYINPAA